MYLVVLDNAHSGDLVVVPGALLDLLAVAAVDLADDVENSGGYLTDKVNVPLFQCLSHYRVIGVGEGVGDDIPALVPAVAAVIKQNAHKLGDSKGGVSVVDMDSHLLMKVVKCAVNGHMPVYDISHGSRAHEILLTVTKALALQVIVVGIKHL